MAGESPKPLSSEDRTRQTGIIVTTIIGCVLVNIVIGLRMATRKWVVKSVGWDDWTIIAADLGVIIGMALVLVQVDYGFGRHATDLSPHEFLQFQKYSYGEWIQTFATLMFTKISICLFLLRITISKAFIRPLQALIAALVISNIVMTLLWIVQCRPILAKAWDKEDKPGSCFSDGQLRAIILAQAIVSIVSDFILAAFPILILRKVQITLRLKFGLCGLMGLGVITGAFCIVRTVINSENISGDPTWVSVGNWYWRSWEVCIGIIAASIPATHPGYKYVIGRYQAKRSAGNSSPSSKKRLAAAAASLSFGRRTKVSPSHNKHSESSVMTEDGFLPLQDVDSRKTTMVDVDQTAESHGSTSDGHISDYAEVVKRMDSEAKFWSTAEGMV